MNHRRSSNRSDGKRFTAPELSDTSRGAWEARPRRLFIAGTQKTGNVWLERLLSHIYDIPTLDLAVVSDVPPSIQQESYVTHQHYLPKPEFLDWAERADVRFLTLTRHPADVFVSLYHYVNRFADIWAQSGWVGFSRAHVMIGKAIDSPEVLTFLADDFGSFIVRSLAWVESGASLVVRYEALHENPHLAMKRLTDELYPVPDSLIDEAIEASRFERMRKENELLELHCRKGKVGDWRDELSPAHVEILRQRYERELALLGYDLGDGVELRARPRTAIALARIEGSTAPRDETRAQLEALEDAIAGNLEEIAAIDALLEASSRELGFRRHSLEQALAHANALDQIVLSLEEERDATKEVLEARDGELETLKSLLDAKAREVEAASAITRSREQEVAAASHLLEARNREVESLTGLLAARKTEIQNALSLLEGRQSEVSAATQLVSNRSDEISSLNTFIDAKKSEVESLRGLLGSREGEIKTLHSMVESRDRELGSVRELLAARDDEVSTLGQYLEDRDTEVAALRSLIESRDEEGAALRRLIETRETETASLRDVVGVRDGEVATLHALLEDRQEEVASVKTILDARDEEIRAFGQLVASKDDEIAALRKALAAREQETKAVGEVIEARNVELASVTSVIQAKNAELESIAALLESSETRSEAKSATSDAIEPQGEDETRASLEPSTRAHQK